jgi:intracellular septation protein A
MYLLYGFLPLLVFVIVDSFTSLKWAVIAALVIAVADIVISYKYLGGWDPGLLVSGVLIMLCGYAAIRSGNPLFIKLQPVALSIILAATLGYFQFLSEPIVYHYRPLLEKMLPPEQAGLLNNDAMLRYLNSLLTWCIPLFLLHGAMIAYTALRCSKWVWIATRAVGFWVLFLLLIIAMSLFKGMPVGVS